MAKKLKTSADNRKCAFPKCEHHLSIYNHAEYCHVHREQMAEGRKTKAPYHHPS